ncbi:class I SAM-dependent methyltransferase [Candidatus Woesearchaeota archaeon]|nr:class I SAM-dependent methyltransferase [Candidatus Woesearchaeota archaeon]
MAKTCISCGSDKNIRIYQKKSFLECPVYRCNKCGLCFFYSDDKGMERKCDEYYKKTYWNTIRRRWDEKRKFLNIIIKILRKVKTEPLQQVWHYNVIKKCASPSKSEKLLDIGCAKGDFMLFFSKMGFDVRGIEPDKNNTKIVNKLFKKEVCINGLVEKVKITEKFGVIYLCHVFEHLIRPDLFLKKIKNNLNRGGIIFLEVPNCENKKILHNSLNYHPHIYSFTLDSMRKLFERSGYNILKLGSYSEIHKSYLMMFFLMLFGMNNYKPFSGEKGERIIVLAKKKGN